MIIEKEFRFEAAHHLPHMTDGHPCKRLHGHSYRFVVQCEAPLCKTTFFVGGLDYSDISKIVNDNVINILDHQNINDFINISTAENLAIWIYNAIKPNMVQLSEISVYETPTSCVKYRGESC